jgi:alkylhydroperoxidase/carboxymuconolactone decarboxylase family protein YurZ
MKERMQQPPPPKAIDFQSRYPEIWQAFTNLAGKCHESGGPLDEKNRRLVKLALAIGTRHEGAVHSAVRHALQAGLSPGELFHVAILSITTIGWPAAQAAISWIHDIVSRTADEGPGEPE